MSRFAEGKNQRQSMFFHELLNDYTSEDNLVREIEVFIEERDLYTSGSEIPQRKKWSPRVLSRGRAQAVHLRLP